MELYPSTSSGREKGKEGRPAPQKNVQGSQAYATFGTIVPHFLKILEHALNTPQMNGFEKWPYDAAISSGVENREIQNL